MCRQFIDKDAFQLDKGYGVRRCIIKFYNKVLYILVEDFLVLTKIVDFELFVAASVWGI